LIYYDKWSKVSLEIRKQEITKSKEQDMKTNANSSAISRLINNIVSTIIEAVIQFSPGADRQLAVPVAVQATSYYVAHPVEYRR
jgi:hypothetical protein